jgi:hypothetical protein
VLKYFSHRVLYSFCPAIMAILHKIENFVRDHNSLDSIKFLVSKKKSFESRLG